MTTIQTLATELGFDNAYGLRAFADDLLDDLASDRDEVPADVEQILRDAVAQGASDEESFEGVAHFPEVAAHFVIDFTADGHPTDDVIPFDDSEDEPTEAEVDATLAAWVPGPQGITWTRTSPLRRDEVTGRLTFDVRGR